ncbi:hypothetical protein [Parapedobacter tibetensis]|uniref:hypothetical protein n=1 Tax=Parapedobacter tibetensis TaxID=2972951 RepID=UPI00214DB599|nr:hypothetical protein [Parapedobacter tibetensis]
MANRTYLYYQKKENEWYEFEYATIIPSLWQELYNIELIEAQKTQIIEAFTKNEEDDLEDEERNANLKVTKEIAIENLKAIINLNLNESGDKKQLRIDFLKFIQFEIADTSIIELSFEEISWFYEQPQDIFIELEKFHIDAQTKTEYSTEKITFQTIGFNDDFKSYSSIYQKLIDEQKAINEKNREEHQLKTEKTKRKERKSKIRDLITMAVIASVLIFFGFFGIFVKNEMRTGLAMLSFSIICWLYVYFKHIKK